MNSHSIHSTIKSKGSEHRMNILSIILLSLLVILLFRVGLSLLRVLIYIGIIVLCIYLGYQGILWIMDHFNYYFNFIN